MPKTDASFDPEEYAPVADRIALFYSRYPNGRILTEFVSRSESEVVFKALVYRSPEERAPAASGWASERFGDGEVNTVACLENTETSAVGRALANLGLTASRNRPSLEEMQKAARAKVAATKRLVVVSPRPGPGVIAAQRVKESPTDPGFYALQHAADRVTDVLQLVAEAERQGLSPPRVRELRERVTSSAAGDSAVERLERALRRWLANHADGAPRPVPRQTRPHRVPPF
jgi:hypothetical protein